MANQKEVYKCEVCGNIVEVLHGGAGALVCCGQNMKLMGEQSEEDGKTEKHRPVVEKTEDGFVIKVGEVLHPMTEEHYIEWIEVFPKDEKSIKVFLKPGDSPEVEVCCEPVKIRAYCNLHGLWKS